MAWLMTKTLKIICLLLLVGISLFASDLDNKLVKFQELHYNSAAEKAAFEAYFIKGEKNYLELFLTLDSTLSNASIEKIKRIVEGTIENYKNPKFQKYKEKKKIKILYGTIHDKYFKKYELITQFNDIFNNGAFNCVTSTALYAILLNELDVPFVIKEKPGHVYLIAYPNSSSILIETTDPQSRIFNYDYRTKSRYIKYLLETKIITPSQLERLGTDGVFAKYFYADGNITIDQLIGIHYMNHAADLLDQRKYKEAFAQLEKSYLFFPIEKIGFIHFIALGSIISNTNYEDIDDISYFFKLPRFRDFGITKEQIVGEFERFSYNVLINQGHVSVFQESYPILIKEIADSALRSEITFIYNYNLGRYFISLGQYNEGSNNAEKAFELKPRNTDALSLFMASLVIKIRNLSPQETLEVLNDYNNKYPTLEKNNVFQGLKMDTYLLLASDNLFNSSDQIGFTYLKSFEEIYGKHPYAPVTENLIVNAYANAGVFYFKKSKYAKCKKYLEKGLKLVPDSQELKLRLMSL